MKSHIEAHNSEVQKHNNIRCIHLNHQNLVRACCRKTMFFPQLYIIECNFYFKQSLGSNDSLFCKLGAGLSVTALKSLQELRLQ